MSEGSGEGLWIDISNEFAAVRVSQSRTRNGVRLVITDRVTGESRLLDALELEALIWATYRDFDRLMDPSHSRWAGNGDV